MGPEAILHLWEENLICSRASTVHLDNYAAAEPENVVDLSPQENVFLSAILSKQLVAPLLEEIAPCVFVALVN